MIPVIAIDGPAGSGKGTMARKLASHFGFVYLDTGSLYRAAAYLNIPEYQISELTAEQFFNMIASIPSQDLRTDDISMKASKLATKSHIRDELNRLQREFVNISLKKSKGAVLDGRDIGTVVIPNAMCKLFITADVETRARRRFNCLKLSNKDTTFETVLNNVKARDAQDSSRAESPMAFNNDYILIDTTNETEEMSFKKILQAIGSTFDEIVKNR